MKFVPLLGVILKDMVTTGAPDPIHNTTHFSIKRKGVLVGSEAMFPKGARPRMAYGGSGMPKYLRGRGH